MDCHVHIVDMTTSMPLNRSIVLDTGYRGRHMPVRCLGKWDQAIRWRGCRMDRARGVQKNGHGKRALGTVLVTGGAGYIGSIPVRRLLHCGYRVRVLDRLMYGDGAIRALYSNDRLEMVVGDFRDREVVMDAVAGM